MVRSSTILFAVLMSAGCSVDQLTDRRTKGSEEQSVSFGITKTPEATSGNCPQDPDLNAVFARVEGRGSQLKAEFIKAAPAKLTVLCVTNNKDYVPGREPPVAGSLRERLAVAEKAPDRFHLIDFDPTVFPAKSQTTIVLGKTLRIPGRTFINGAHRKGTTLRTPRILLRMEIDWTNMSLDVDLPQCVKNHGAKDHTVLRFDHARFSGISGIEFRKTHMAGKPIPEWYTRLGSTLQYDCLSDTVMILGDSTVAVVENVFRDICGDECISIRDYKRDGTPSAIARVSIGYNSFIDTNKAVMASDADGAKSALASPRMLGSIYRNNFINVKQRSPRLAGPIDFQVHNNYNRNWKWNAVAFSPDVTLNMYDNFYDPGAGKSVYAVNQIVSIDNANFVGKTPKKFTRNLILTPGGGITTRGTPGSFIENFFDIPGTKWLRPSRSAGKYLVCPTRTGSNGCVTTAISLDTYGHGNK